MTENKLKNEIIDEELRAETELRKEAEDFREKILGMQDEEIAKNNEINDNLAKDVDSLKEAELNDKRNYENLVVSSLELEEKLRAAEAEEKRKRLDLYYKEAAKQTSISERELKKAEELIKKSYYIKEAKDKLNALIEEKRDASKSKQIEYSSNIIDKIDRNKREKSMETNRMIERIQLQKDFIKVRYAKDQRATVEAERKAAERRSELTQSIVLVREKRKAMQENVASEKESFASEVEWEVRKDGARKAK